MKKFIVLLLVFLLAFALVSCEDEPVDDTTKQNNENQENTEEPDFPSYGDEGVVLPPIPIT